MNDKSRGEIIIYTKPEGSTEIQVTLKDETVWLTESEMACLFDRDRTVIGRHIRNIFRENELDEKSNVQKTHIPNSDKPVSFFTHPFISTMSLR